MKDCKKKKQSLLRVITAIVCAVSMLVGTAELGYVHAEDAAGVELGGFRIIGGEAGVDYELSGDVLQIKTSTALTIQNVNISTPNSVGIQICPGVQANLTLAGVNIARNGIPLDVATNLYDTESGAAATEGDQIRNKTSLYLSLADGTANTLKPNGEFPGLHCGEGSILFIDDSVRNIDSDGNPITPKQGRVPYDCTLEKGTEIHKGDPLYVMESADPGKLIAYIGIASAAIGAGSRENAGNMTFNGGYIETISPFSGGGGIDESAAGIGSGDGGSCTVITINGGTIVARGTYHGAAIGTGCALGWGGFDRPQLANTILTRNGWRVCPVGDIYVNGGNTTAYGTAHGNAFGAGCQAGNDTDNTGHVLIVTGGNLTPVSGGYGALGAVNTDIQVIGGSFQCSNFNGTVTDGNGNTLSMATIDLSIYPERPCQQCGRPRQAVLLAAKHRRRKDNHHRQRGYGG